MELKMDSGEADVNIQVQIKHAEKHCKVVETTETLITSEDFRDWGLGEHSMSNLFNLIGIPFKDRGRTKSGCDCMGLAVMTHKELGQDIPDFLVQSEDSDEINATFITQLYSSNWTQVESPCVPCIVVFGFDENHKDMVTHVGTYIGENKVLHILTDKTSNIIKLDHPFFKNKILGFYKYEQN